MRNQLEVIHAIDNYLRGVLDETETQVFENRLKTDTQLQEEVAKQQVLMEAIKRSALTASAAKGKKKYKTIKTLKYVGVFVVAAAVATASVYFVNQNNEKPKTETIPSIELGIEALPTQGFELNTAQDTVIETENGSVFAIPADAFETENGEAVTGNVNFEIKEAFEEVDIMKAGLTTTSDGKLLETGGMFFLDATQNGKPLRLKKGKEILSQLPNNQPDKNMMLFDGVQQTDGTINWVNPQEFEKELITVDITSLDFYPEGYVEELTQTKDRVLVKAEGDIPSRRMTIDEGRKLGYKYPVAEISEQDAIKLGLITREYEDVVTDKKLYPKEFTDSLYYSFARLFDKNNSPIIEYDTTIAQAVAVDDKGKIVSYGERDTAIEIVSDVEEANPCPIPSGINPAKVKAIWNKKFNKTILATKEFEERMKVIHESRQDRIFEVYVNNLDKPLWYSDSIAMITFSETKEKFKVFYEQRKGGVKVNDRLANKLTSYFTKKHKEFTTKSSEAFNEYESNKRKLRAEFANKKSKKEVEEFNRKAKAFQEEYEINRCDAYSQIYANYDCNQKPIPTVNVRIASLGPKNLDVYVFEATRDRKTMNYTDPASGKKAILVYKPVKAKITNSEKFDKVFVYMLPDSLASFNRMNSSDNINFDFSLNMLFKYKLIAIAYKDKQAYIAEVESVSPKEYALTLAAISESELKQKLNRTKSKVKEDITSDKDYYEEEMVNTSREKKYKADGQLMLEIGHFLFPDVSENCLELTIKNEFESSGLIE